MAHLLGRHQVQVGSGRYLLVAAIDFGTTFSGYAFSFTSSKDNIIMNKNWGSQVGFQAHKTETAVLLGPNRKFKAFGYQASKTYSELEEKEATRHYYFHRFKMELYTEKKLTKDTTIKDVNGKKLPALDIFAHAMRYLKDHMLNAIKVTVGSEKAIKNDDICWVLTVPAIWDDSAKQFMRQAAYKAGIANESNKGQLLIALEPEAAGVFCRRDATENQHIDIQLGDRFMIRGFAEEGSYCPSSRTSTLRSRFVPTWNYTKAFNTSFLQNWCSNMFIPLTGGTVDIAVHEIHENSQVKEVATVSGGSWGGTKVDEQFLNLLDDIFGADNMARYKVAHPNEYLNLLYEFEQKKRSTAPHLDSPNDSGACVVGVHLGYNFFNFYPKQKGGRDVQKAIKKYGSPDVTFSNGVIRMSHALMKSFFTPAIDSILDHLDKLLKKEVSMPLKCMFMVGGFSESPILQHKVKQRFQSQCDVIVPDGCGLAIIKGAVMFGHNPSSIAARMSKYTYGAHVCNPFIKGQHPDRLWKKIDGKPMCSQLFHKFVEAGQLVDVDEVSEHIFSPSSRFHLTMSIEIFRTKEKEVQYCDEEGVVKCGYLSVGLPSPFSGSSRDVKAIITFAETEIKVDAVALGSGKRESTTIDFLRV
uniref:Heat shock 70 kDa protein 12A n=1 Tax=Branchiostoma floridae TaxID=7739 RepID=C3ZGG0_BRAFL|eukprot:XP_002592330.1 hypothetical protein BRAFLDRAFT_240194 [Branchiostoma floridae]